MISIQREIVITHQEKKKTLQIIYLISETGKLATDFLLILLYCSILSFNSLETERSN